MTGPSNTVWAKYVVQCRSKSRFEKRRSLCLAAALSLVQIGCGQRDDALLASRRSSLPDVTLPLLDSGQQIALGKGIGPCLINFWATWCPPCRAEMASLQRLHQALSGRGFKVLAVSVDRDPHLVREYLLETSLDFPVLLDPDGVVSERSFQVQAYPTTWLVDINSVVRDIWQGERDWDDKAIRSAVDQLFSSI